MKATDIKELRNFGLLTGGILAGIFGLALPLLLYRSINIWCWGIGGVLLLAGIAFPTQLKPLHTVWMQVGHILGWINTRIILGIFFFCILLPAGIIMRIAGHDPMRRKFEPDAETYRIPAKIPANNHFERPF